MHSACNSKTSHRQWWSSSSIGTGLWRGCMHGHQEEAGAGVVPGIPEVGVVETVLKGGVHLCLGLHNCVLTSWLQLASVQEGGPC
eukprot:1149759-Pelagomonas_calceolata.AAC.2